MFAFLEKKVFSKDTLRFFEKFVWLFYLYLAWRFIDFSPTLYTTLNPIMGQAPGLLEALPLPSLPVLWTAQILGFVACLLAASGVKYRLSSLVVVLSWGLIEFGRNALGFINIEIHLLWFAALMTLCPLDRMQRGQPRSLDVSSGVFVFLQLILVLVYLQSGFAKLWTSGFEWATAGTTLQIALLRQGMPLGFWLAPHTLSIQVLSVLSVVLEFSFLLYPFVSRIRVPLLISSIFFHFGTHLLLGISFHHLWILSLGLVLFGRALIDSPGTLHNPQKSSYKGVV